MIFVWKALQQIKQLLTTDSGVGLDKHLSSFLPQKHRLAEAWEAVSATVADSGVAIVQSPAPFHIRSGLKDLQKSSTHHLIHNVYGKYEG